jgi:hypothetical protein
MQLIATTSVSANNQETYGVIVEHTLRLPRSDIVATAALSIVLPVITRFENANTGPENAFFAFISGYRRGGTGEYVYTSDLGFEERSQLHIADCVAVTFAVYIIRGVGTAVGTVFGSPHVQYGSDRVKLEAVHVVADGLTGSIRHTTLTSTVEGAGEDPGDPAEDALRSARQWLPEETPLRVVRHDRPPTTGLVPGVLPYPGSIGGRVIHPTTGDATNPESEQS